MTIEEKAKRYDEVSQEVKGFFEGKQKMNSDVTKALEHLFPELKESEDERIRKELLAVVGDLVLPDDQQSRFVIWLEKQGKISPILSNSSNIGKNWNEEDEKRVKNILSVLDAQVCWDGATGKKMNPYQKEIDWLKSLSLQSK